MHPENCPVPEVLYPRTVVEGLGAPVGSWETPLSPTEMLSGSEEDRVSSNTNSYDYGESSALCLAGMERWGDGAIQVPPQLSSGPGLPAPLPGPGLFLIPKGWGDWWEGEGRGFPGG